MKVIADYVFIDHMQNFRAITKIIDIDKESIDEKYEITKEDLKDKTEYINLCEYKNKYNSEDDKYIKLIPKEIYKCPFRQGHDIYIFVICDYEGCKYFEKIDRSNYEKKNKLPFNLRFTQQMFIIDPTTERPLGFPRKDQGDPPEKGPYLAGVGTMASIGRGFSNELLAYCLYSNIGISKIITGATPGQFEYTIINNENNIEKLCYDLIATRYITNRITEKNKLIVSYNSKPETGKWNGSGLLIYLDFEKYNKNENENKNDYITKFLKKMGISHSKMISIMTDKNKERLYELGLSNMEYNIGIKSGENMIIKYNENLYLDRRSPSNTNPFLIYEYYLSINKELTQL